MQRWLAGKRVFVTGGTGSFGQKFLRTARDAGCASITLFSRDEMKHARLKRELGAEAREVDFRIGDITDAEALAMALRGADLIIHAAAMKHLPECEANVGASSHVNVLGTKIVANAFLRSSAEALVFLSTDKAPYASSVYGAQKYIGEKIVTETARFAGPDRRAFSMRYSNVIDSTGAAFNVFREMLLAEGVVKVNGAETSRGFVTQANVILWLERALQEARGGEVLVLIPQVIRILELAQVMRTLLNRGSVQLLETPGFVGEKESATLVMSEEQVVAKDFSHPPHSAVLLDSLERHPDRVRYALPRKGLTLEDCERLTGPNLEAFLAAQL